MSMHFGSGLDPLVAVVIPAYNAASTLDAALHSARGQSYNPLEIIVVNDGSTDETARIVAAHERKDPRVRMISQNQQGVAAARNRGVWECNADFVAMLDADDLWHPEKIKRAMQALMDAGESCGLVYTFSDVIDENDLVMRQEAFPQRPYQGFVLPDLLLNNFIGNGSSPILRKSVVMQVGGYDPNLRAQRAEGCEDLKLYLAVAETHSFAAVPLALTGYRITSTSMSSNIMRMIRSHQLVTEPYRARYPDQVRLGRVYLAIYYAGREYIAGNYPGCYRAVREALRADPGVTVKAIIRKLQRRMSRAAVGATEPVRFNAARAAESGTHGIPSLVDDFGA
jgi:glycosyltransferase involved in cell wall biosynthesis